MSWKSMAMVDITGDQSAPYWPVTSLQCGPFYPELNSGLLFEGLNPVKAEDGSLMVVGVEVPRFLAQFDRVISWKWVAENVLQEIRRYGTGTQVGFATTFESMNQQEPWDLASKPWWSYLKQYRLPGTHPNTNGDPFVDVYEKAAGHEAKNHSWQVNIADVFVSQTMAVVLRYCLDAYYRTYRPDFLFFDCFQERFFPGSATNAPAFPEEEYRAGWLDLLGTTQSQCCPIWGHNPGFSHYVDLFGRIHEDFFSNTNPASVIVSETNDMSRACGIGITRGTNTKWLQSQDLWDGLRKEVEKMGGFRDDRVYVELARTGPNFGIFHPGLGIVNTHKTYF